MPRNREGFYGSFEGYDRDFGAGGNLGRYDIGYRNEYGGGYRGQQGGAGRWGGYSDQGLGGRYNGFGGRERMTFGPREEYDRDLGDQLREGWHDLKRGVRRAFGGGYDAGWRGEGRWGSEEGIGRGGYEGGGRFGREGGFGNRGYSSGRGPSGEGRWGPEGGPGRGSYEGGGGRGWGGGEGIGRGWRGGQESGYGQGNRGFLGDRFETGGYGGDYQW